MGVLRLGKMGQKLQAPQGHAILHPGWWLCYPPSRLLPTSQPYSVLTAHCVPGCLKFLPLDTPDLPLPGPSPD